MHDCGAAAEPSLAAQVIMALAILYAFGQCRRPNPKALKAVGVWGAQGGGAAAVLALGGGARGGQRTHVLCMCWRTTHVHTCMRNAMPRDHAHDD